ncbi:MAG: DMT family transporter [Ilumatobacteraceae bacterium]
MDTTTTTPDIAPEDVDLRAADWVALALPGLIWGSSFFLIAEGLEAFSPFLVTWLRLAFGLAVLVSLPATRRPLPASLRPRLLGLGVVWMTIPLSLFPLAEQRVSSSVTGMLNGANPIFTAIVAAIMARSLPPGRQLGGLAIGLAGVVMIALPSWSDGGSSIVGVVMVLSALACYGVALNIAGPLQRRIGSIPVISRTMAVAFVLTAPLGIAAFASSSFRWRSALAVAVLGALGTGVAYVLMASNAGRFGSTRASSTTYLIPGVSIALGVVIRHEDVRPLAVAGSLVALSGAYLVNSRAATRAD